MSPDALFLAAVEAPRALSPAGPTMNAPFAYVEAD